MNGTVVQDNNMLWTREGAKLWCVSLLTYYFLFHISPFYIRTYPPHILLFRLCLIPVIMLYPHTTVLLIDLLCVPFD